MSYAFTSKYANKTRWSQMVALEIDHQYEFRFQLSATSAKSRRRCW